MANDTPSRRSLPNETVLIILHHVTQLSWLYLYNRRTLHSCSLVNKQFHALANPFLWEKPLISGEVRYKRFLTCLDYAHAYSQQHQDHPSPGRLVHQLILRHDTLTDAQLERVWPHVPNVQYVKLPYRSWITDTSIQQLPRHCHHLTSLELHRMILSSATFLDLGRYCRQLGRLYLCDCLMSSRNILKPLSDNDTPLQELTLSTCGMDQDTQATDLTHLKHLTYLTLLHVPPATMKYLLGKAATTTTYPWSHLKRLYLDKCMEIDDDTWLAFLKAHPQLQDITITDCIVVTDASMIPMATWLPHLIHVQFIGLTPITPDGIRQLIQYAPATLQSVRCHDCPAIRIGHFPELPSLQATGTMVELDFIAIETIRRGSVNQ